RVERFSPLARGLCDLCERQTLLSANGGLLLKGTCVGVGCSHIGCECLEVGGKRFRRGLPRAAGDEGAGAAISAGIVAAMRRVGLLEVNSIDRGGERGGGDLAMYR